MNLVAITGGIGSGKTHLAKLFQNLGVPVFFADDQAKALMQNSASLRAKIIDVFGKMSYKNDELNRPYLANLVFNDKTKLAKLNEIVHPAVKAHFKNWLLKQKSDYIIYENAILFETNSAVDFDYIICVTADLETRINRIIKRDGSTRQQALSRIENQMDDNERIKKSDLVVYNNSDENLNKEVLKIHQNLLKLFAK